jgi:RNA polymerase sigma factor (sigma-70 family)
MAIATLSTFLRSLRARLGPSSGALTDGQLLDRWLAQRDEAAFELLVWRHGPAVLGVCRRLLPADDIEDAFQATFLALHRKAGSIGDRQAVGGWLYQVAYRAALRIRAAASRQPRQAQPGLNPPAPEEVRGDELRPVLDEEVSKLPEKLRGAFVLCCVEGLTLDEAAGQLGCPPGTVSSRLTRARQRLRQRLTWRGVGLPAGACAAGLSRSTASACVSTTLVRSTVQAAARVAAGQAAEVVVTARAAAVLEAVLRTMFMTRLKVAAMLFLVMGAVTGTAGLGYRARAAGELPERPPVGLVAEEKPAPARAETDKEARERLEKALAELQQRLRQAQAQAEVERARYLVQRQETELVKRELNRSRTEIDGVLTRVDIEKNTLSLTLGQTALALEAVPISAEAKFYLGEKECSINDLKPGMKASLRVATEKDKSMVVLIRGQAKKK